MNESEKKALPSGRNPYLWLLKYAAEDERFLRILVLLASQIRRIEKEFDEARDGGNEEYLDHLTDEECAYLEEVLGVAFLILQGKIRRVEANAKRLRNAMQEQYAIDIPLFKNSSELRSIGMSRKTKNATFIQRVWDLGNYYKHTDEWPHEVWEGPKRSGKSGLKLERATRRRVQRLGLEQFSTGNLRTGFEAITSRGASYSEVDRIGKKVQDWANAVYKTGASAIKDAVKDM